MVRILCNDAVVDADLVTATVAHTDGGGFSAKIFYHAEPDKLWYADAGWLAGKQDFQHVGVDEIDDGNAYGQISETDYAIGDCPDEVRHLRVGQ